MRKLLVVGVVLVIVLSTALIPKPAPRVFAVREVIQTFEQNGIALRRELFDPRHALETLVSPRSDVVVVVYRRARPGTRASGNSHGMHRARGAPTSSRPGPDAAPLFAWRSAA